MPIHPLPAQQELPFEALAHRRSTVASCGGCGATWTALGAAHCAAPGCHVTYPSVAAFVAHRELRLCPALHHAGRVRRKRWRQRRWPEHGQGLIAA